MDITQIDKMRKLQDRLVNRSCTEDNLKTSLLLMEAAETIGNLLVSRYEWISIEDRLPENGVHCLLCCTAKFNGGTRRPYVCDGFYAERYKNLAYGVDDDRVTDYNEENDEYYISEGWYEIINNWDDYDFIAIDDFVTHWMLLPALPTENS